MVEKIVQFTKYKQLLKAYCMFRKNSANNQTRIKYDNSLIYVNYLGQNIYSQLNK